MVDRLEGDAAVLIDDADGKAYDVPAAALTMPPREALVLRVVDGSDGAPDWASAVADDAERERRTSELGARAARLRESDPGGDTAL